MANRVRVRSFKEAFWSAGRRWTDAGRTVSIVEDDQIPDEFFRPVVDKFGKLIEGKRELDLPYCDPAYQRWIEDKRRKHDGVDEITRSEYEMLKLDKRFLALETPDEDIQPARDRKAILEAAARKG
jgi:hypothetical protein